MKTFMHKLTFFLGFALIPVCLFGQEAAEGEGRGVVIIALKEGPTRFLDSEGNVLPEEKTKQGAALPEGNSAQAGVGGKIILLFSNGTVMTLESQSMLKIREFSQEPFDARGRKVEDLKEEPSKSNVKLDLDWGSIVVGTKKLDRESSLDISTPSGTAGIRGTQFQMSQNPGTGLKLDVTESTVAFTPKGAARPVAIGPGRGLDVSSAGVATPRPVNPVVAQNINVNNNVAEQATKEVPLGAVSEAMNSATTEAKQEEGARPREGGPREAEERRGEAGDEPGEQGGREGSRNERRGEVADPKKRTEDVSSAGVGKVDKSQVLENNSDARQARKTGKASPKAKEITRLGLSDKDASVFYGFGVGLQDSFLKAGPEKTRRLLSLLDKGVSESHLSNFFSYSGETREKILSLSNDVSVANLIAKQYAESWLEGILTEENLTAMNSGGTPVAQPSTASQNDFLALNDNLRETGNSAILDELLEAGGGTLTEELLREGDVANLLLADGSFAGDLSGSSLVSGEEALVNRFYQDVASVYQGLESDQLVAGKPAFIGGDKLTLAGGSYDLSDLALTGMDSLAFGAVDKLSLSGSLSFSGDAGASKRIVVMSGNELEGSQGLTLDAATNDLVLSARRDVVLEGAVLRGSSEVGIHSMRNLNLVGSEVSASNLATLKAAKEMYVDGLTFNQNLPKIVMEATTIRLANINFPANAAVNLNSLKGAIDGKYPNFGTNVSAAQQLGRVNFLNNVKAGGNLMHDRASFDQFGGNISIGKLR